MEQNQEQIAQCNVDAVKPELSSAADNLRQTMKLSTPGM